MFEKVWGQHVVRRAAGEPDLLYVDLHLVHEVTSPQAFDGLRLGGRTVRRPDLTVATEDHNVPTADIDRPIADPISAKQVDTLRANDMRDGVHIRLTLTRGKKVTSGMAAIAIALSMISMGVTQTGHPGPCTNVTWPGSI